MSGPAPRDRDGANVGPGLALEVRPDLSAIGDARNVVRRYLDEQAVARRVIDDLLLVVDELLSNSIEHGAAYRRAGTALELRFESAREDLRMTFVDRDCPAAEVVRIAERASEPPNVLPAVDLERGRGFFLIASGLDEYSIRALDAGTGAGLVIEGCKRRQG